MAIDSNSTLRSVFIVWNNPEVDYTYRHAEDGEIVRDKNGKPQILSQKDTILTGKTPDEICEYVIKCWCASKEGRTGACTYCISADGLIHLHIVLECGRGDKFRYSTIQKLYNQKFHLEPTRGNKDQAEDYINKQGKYAEKGEVVIAKYQHGEIQGNQGNRSDLKAIEGLLSEGKTPSEIMRENFSFRRYEKMIRDAYFDKRSIETPYKRQINVIWHYGETGTGKSYTSYKLVEEKGLDRVYVINDFENGGLDHYCGQEILFMDEFRGQWKYAQLLAALDGYKIEMHARNTNTLPLWTEVHITSPLTPDEVYQNMMTSGKHDSINQLLRRLTTIIHHSKTPDGKYKEFSVPGIECMGIRGTIRDYIKSAEYIDSLNLKKENDIEEEGEEMLPY